MLKVIRSPRELPSEQVYESATDRDYLRRDFFDAPGARLCLWYTDGVCVSALRLEFWRDGVLLCGLETAGSCRRRGFAEALIRAVQNYLTEQGSGKLYSHINKRNAASIRVHEKSGFRKISDTARLLDGTVTAQMGTYLFEF